MSGPIVRSYGVPNWDDIFGKKESEKGRSKKKAAPGAKAKAKVAEKAPAKSKKSKPSKRK